LDTRPIGIEDNFFEIGGNSILSITVAHQMSQFLGCSIYVSDIFRLKTINSIIKKCSNVTFNLIKPLSPEQNKKDIIYFIHPAFSGCEVYQGLVDKLSDFYCCIGVDNYNLHHDQKINVLSELAFHYLSYLDFDNTEGKKILLLGWSLGGLIALEMAYMLEQFYPEKVATRLILLDSHLPRGKTLTYHPHFDPQKGEQTIDEFVDTLIKGLDKTYAEKVLMNKGTEILLGQTKPSGKLGLTRVTLFKALKNSGYKWKDNNLKHYANSFDVVEVNSDHMQMITTILNEWDRYSPIFLGETNFNSQISRSFNFLKRIVEVLKSREMVTSIIALIGFVVYFMISSGD
ncbi:hypothetical protein IB691_02785, partial [Fangia hongkongensis]|nr:hypothetical protein [Fangia hongkongensis]